MNAAWDLLNVVARIGIMLIVAYKLTVWRDSFNWPERIGMGVAGGVGFLTIPAVWRIAYNPFEDWSSALFGVGIFIYFCGRLYRLHRHHHNNALATEQARTHLAQRGKS